MKSQLCVLVFLLLLPVGLTSHAVIVVNAPGFGPDVVVRGSGALPSGSVEVFVNGVSKGSVGVNTKGEWQMSGLNLVTGDDVYATLSKVWNFNTAGEAEGWVPDPANHAGVDVSGGTLKMTLNDVTDPYIYNPSLSINSNQYRVLQMRVKNPTNQSAFQVFFDGPNIDGAPGTPGNDKVSLWPFLSSEFQTLNFDLGYNNDGTWANNSRWMIENPINFLRIDTYRHDGGDVSGDVGQVIEFDWIRLTEYISFEFDDAGDFATLKPATAIDMTNVQVAGGKLSFTVADTNTDTFLDPYISVGGDVGNVLDYPLNSNYYSKLDIGGNWTSSNSPNKYELYWADNILSGGLEGWAVNGNVAHSPAFNADGTFHTVTTDLLFASEPPTPTWGGSHSPAWFNPLRFDLFQNAANGDTASIDYIRLRPNLTYGPSAVVETTSSPGEATLHLMVVNGSFEDSAPGAYPGYGPVPGWSYYSTGAPGSTGLNDSNGPFHDNGKIYHGSNIAFVQHAGVFYQEVAGFEAGKNYTLCYRENARTSGYGATPPQLEVRLNGVALIPVHDVATGGYVLKQTNFASPGAGAFLLEFEFYENEADQSLLFETVSIVPQGDPEPFTENPDVPIPVTGIVTNGGFEESVYNTTWPHYGPVAAWSGASGVNKSDGPFHDNGTIPEGDLIGFKQGDGIVSQMVGPLTTGTNYTLRFRENARLPGPIDLEVRLNGTVLVPLHSVYADDEEGYILQSVDFVSPGAGNFLLEFQTYTYGADATLLLDTISITLPGQEEPFDFGPDTMDWPVNCFKVTTPPVIDGNIDVANEYPNAQVMDLRLSTLTSPDPYFPEAVHTGTMLAAGGSIDDDGDASGLLYFGWDSNALYIAANVRDESLNPSTNPTVNGGDAFQVCLDYDQTDAVDAQTDEAKIFIPSYAIADNTNNADYYQQFWPTSDPSPFTGTTWAVVTSSMGYRLETRIPWTAFTSGGQTFANPFPPVNNQTMGMLPMIEDHDGGTGVGIAFLYTAGDGANIIVNGSFYQDLIFLDVTAVEDWALY